MRWPPKKGDRVLAHWAMNTWPSAQVLDIVDGAYVIRFDFANGISAEEPYPLEELAPAPEFELLHQQPKEPEC